MSEVSLDFYNTNNGFKQYVDKFCRTYKVPVKSAFSNALVMEAEEYYREEEKNKAGVVSIKQPVKLEFDRDFFEGLYNFFVFNKSRYSKKEAMSIVKENAYFNENHFYIGTCFVRSVSESEGTTGFVMEFQGKPDSTECWVVVATEKEDIYLANKYKVE